MLDFHYCPRAAWCVLFPRIIILAALYVFSDLSVHAQFEDVTEMYSLYVESEPGVVECGVSMHDFDRDGLVDLTYASNGFGVFTYRNTGSGFEQLYMLSGVSGLVAHPIWVDFDNDGDSDFFATRGHDCPVLMRNDGDLVFTDVSDALECAFANPYSTCASWGDYNADGWIDLYLANYYANSPGPTSWFYRNNGDGSFTEMAEELSIENGVLPTYQVLWVDYDLDFDQDLLICNDKYTGNKLYRNNGDGSFEDWSEESGFEVDLDAMSLSVADFDHDMDYDFYISNTESGNFFMVNDSGMFSNQSEALQTAVNLQCWGTVFIDTQGKTWEDLYVVNTTAIGGNVLLKNRQGEDFDSDYAAFGEQDDELIYSAAKGDINGNGSYDVAVNSFTNNQSLLFQSSLAFEGWVGVDLQGTVSNRDGIGAHVSCYIGGAQFMRPKTCGENFLSQDSQYLLFATNNEPVDSVVVQWPSGIRDVLYNPEPNQTHLIVETETQEIVQVVELMLCSGDSLTLAPQGAAQVSWSTGEQELTLEVSAAGEYGASIIDEQGQAAEIVYYVSVRPDMNYQLQVMEPSCHDALDGVIQWFSSEWIQVWLNDTLMESTSALGIAAGQYQLRIIDEYGCEVDSMLVLENPPMLNVQMNVTPGCYGEYSDYVLSVENSQGNVVLTGLDSLEGSAPEGEYVYTILDEMGCSFSSVLTIETMEPFVVEDYRDTLCADEFITQVELQFSGGVSPWTVVGGGLPLDALSPGEYQIQWIDAAGCMATGNVSILQFEPIVIEAEQNLGQIVLEIEGGLPPYEVEWDNGTTGLVLSADPGTYTYFVSDDVGCMLQAAVELVVGLDEVVVPAISAYPMPFDEVLQWSGPSPWYWQVFNGQGQLVADTTTYPWGKWDTSGWASGVYVLRAAQSDHQLLTMKLVKR
jgi:hypothetical protein